MNRLRDLLAQLRSEENSELQRVSLREDIAKIICAEHSSGAEPTLQDIQNVLHKYGIAFVLKPEEVLRMWHWKQLDGTPAFAVAKQLNISTEPSERLVQSTIDKHIRNLRRQWRQTDVSGTLEAYDAEIARFKALTPEGVLQTLDVCRQHDLPPFK